MYKDYSNQLVCQRKGYAKNPSKVIAKVKERREQIKKWFTEYKSNLSCIRCGEDTIVCLDFHHLDPTKKEMCIARAVNRGWSKERILREANKCLVLCKNCHAKIHDK